MPSYVSLVCLHEWTKPNNESVDSEDVVDSSIFE